jgi:hypothetical protein
MAYMADNADPVRVGAGVRFEVETSFMARVRVTIRVREGFRSRYIQSGDHANGCAQEIHGLDLLDDPARSLVGALPRLTALTHLRLRASGQDPLLTWANKVDLDLILDSVCLEGIDLTVRHLVSTPVTHCLWQRTTHPIESVQHAAFPATQVDLDVVRLPLSLVELHVDGFMHIPVCAEHRL